MTTPTVGTVYGQNTCRACGNPAGIHSTFARLCPRCFNDTAYRRQITRAYVARIRPNVSPTCPYDAIAHHEADALGQMLGFDQTEDYDA